MKWSSPPLIKIYEALGAVIDERIDISGSTAKVYSSSGSKFYTVTYTPDQNEIMANDNGSYWKGYLGYPSIAYLFKIGVLPYREDFAQYFQGIAWKDLNTKFKNDFDKTITHIFTSIPSPTQTEIIKYAESLLEEINKLDLGYSGTKARPPAGY